jgi:HAE1 family hydrophobic/amphiphilic exporter-1
MTTVVTIYPQAQPEEVMNKVTIPVENAIAGIKGLKQLASSSSENTSIVYAEFDYSVNIDEVNRTIVENLSQIALPPEVRNLPAVMPQITQNPRVVPLDINALPSVTLALAGDLPLKELNQIAETQVVPQLETVKGVFDVSMGGGQGDRVLVNPSLVELNAQGVSIGQVAIALSTQKFNSTQEIRNAFLNPTGLQLKQVADVTLGPVPGSVVNRTNGKPSVSLRVSKLAEANLVATANAIVEKAEEIKKSLPEGVELYILLDQSTFIENSISDLTINAGLGAALAIVVVFLFLMAFGASLVTAVSIPLSVLLGFLAMRITNISINIITLSAMIIAIGQVIDNSIVVLEVTYRRMQKGERFFDAAVNGTREVINPITATTLATVIIFIPLIFVGGIIGEMFVPFALTITYAMLGSLLVALTVVPALGKFLAVKKSGAERPAPGYQNAYVRLLKWCLGHRALTISAAFALFLGSLGLIPVVGTSFMPELNVNVIGVEIEMPKGSTQTELVNAVIRAEEIISQNAGIVNYNSTIGSSRSIGTGFMSAFGASTRGLVAEITATTFSQVKATLVASQLQESLSAIQTSGKFTVSAMHAMSADSSSTLEVQVRGDSIQDVTGVAQALSTRLRAVSGLGEQEVTVVSTAPKLIVEVDTARLTAAGATPAQVDQLQKELALLKQGGTISSVSLNGLPYDVTLLPVFQPATDTGMLKNIKLGSLNGRTLGEIALVSVDSLPTEIRRTDRKIAATVTAPITAKDIGGVNRVVQTQIDALTKPAGVEIDMGGVSEEMQESFRSMSRAILIAISLVFVLLVVLYRSLRNTLIIMVSLPLASIGAFFGLLVTGNTLGVSGLLGILQLVGIVLANAVLLIAYVEQLRKQGVPAHDALVTGGQTRLRPILMTAITTLIAIVPVAFGMGEGVIMATEMAVVVIGGLFSSTLLTLLVVPVVYSLVYDRRRKAVK